MAKIISGKKIAKDLYLKFKNEIFYFRKRFNLTLKLAVLCIGGSAASRIYLNCKKKVCKDLGIDFEPYIASSTVSEQNVINLLQKLNLRNDITGILLQLPLPSNFNKEKILTSIDVNKDIDSLNPLNLGKLVFPSYKEGKDFAPCTALAILKILEYEQIDVVGKHVVIIGKSNIVGKPLALILSQRKATVTLCNSNTKNLNNICKSAEIIVSCTGVKHLIKKEMVTPGTVVIDAGILADNEGRVSGDVNFEEVAPMASVITPVPGGVGPVTVAMIINNLIIAAKKKYY